MDCNDKKDFCDTQFSDLKGNVSKVQDELSSIQKDLSALQTDIQIVSTYVSNHLPHQIEELKVVLQGFDGRIKPFEKGYLQYQGISGFMAHLVKFVVVVGGLIWTAIQVYTFFKVH